MLYCYLHAAWKFCTLAPFRKVNNRFRFLQININTFRLHFNFRGFFTLESFYLNRKTVETAGKFFWRFGKGVLNLQADNKRGAIRRLRLYPGNLTRPVPPEGLVTPPFFTGAIFHIFPYHTRFLTFCRRNRYHLSVSTFLYHYLLYHYRDMEIIVNKVNTEVDEGVSLYDLLEDRGMTGPGIAVAVEGKVVRRADWPSLKLTAGMEITVITAVCGG